MIKWRNPFSKKSAPDLSTGYEGRCGNCQEYLGDDDNYCRYCGTKRGKGKFKPYDNIMPTIYGSPLTYIHRCKKCGIEFTSGMGTQPKYCYHCGSKVTTCLEEETTITPAVQYSQYMPPDDHGNNYTGIPVKNTLTGSIILYDMFTDGWTGDGKRCGGEHRIEYCHNERIVKETHSFYGEGITRSENVDCVLAVPKHIRFKEDLIDYIKSQKPDWDIQ